MKAKTTWMAALITIAALLIATTGISAEKNVQPQKNAATNPASNAFGQGFADWLRDYWAWSYGGVGPQVQPNNVFFMPVPVPADDAWETKDGKLIGTAQMDLTVEPGTKLVLGVLSWIGETYDPKLVPPIPDDDPAFFTIADFLPPNGQVEVMLDGVPLINDANLASFYYDPIRFINPLMYAEPTSYGSIGAIFVQGIGVIIQPMTPGRHTLTLYSWDSWKGLYGDTGVGWFNTWNITVAPPGKK